jgi:hypothetical protein
MRRRWCVALLVAAVPFVSLTMLGIAAVLPDMPWDSQPPLPPLLRGATAGGGWWGACPLPKELSGTTVNSTLALSPELNQRLQQEFPPGSREDALVSSLVRQQFQIQSPCRDDNSIRVARFQQHGGLYPMTADVYWKTDQDNNVIWTKGFIQFTGL